MGPASGFKAEESDHIWRAHLMIVRAPVCEIAESAVSKGTSLKGQSAMLMLEKPAITLSIFGAVLAASLSLSAQAPAPTPQPSTPATPAAAPRPTRPPLTPEQEAARQKAAAEQEADHADMMRQLGITSMRPGADSDKKSPHAANFDEAKVPAYTPPPDPLVFPDGSAVVESAPSSDRQAARNRDVRQHTGRRPEGYLVGSQDQR
jgi:hypothetical protein